MQKSNIDTGYDLLKKREYALALKKFLQVEQSGDPVGSFYSALIYADEDSQFFDRGVAIEKLELAMERGVEIAASELGRIYFRQEKYEKAKQVWLEASGDTKVMYSYWAYVAAVRAGDVAHAKHTLLLRAANLGNPIAKLDIAREGIRSGGIYNRVRSIVAFIKYTVIVARDERYSVHFE